MKMAGKSAVKARHGQSYAFPLGGASTATGKRTADVQNAIHMHFLECLYLKEEEGCREALEKILERREKWVKVDDVDVFPACAVGENFAADVFRVVVYGRRLCLGVWTDFRKNLIVKTVPRSTSPMHRLYDCARMFQNEVVAYERILPMCQSHLDNSSRDESRELSFPKYFGRWEEFLVLQDLQTEGYQQVNRVKGFTLRECSLVLRELSKFHALSFALRKHDRVSFSKTVDELKEAIYLEEHVTDLTGVFWENSVKFALKSVEDSGDPRLEKVSHVLRFHSGKILRTLIDLIRPDFGKFDVLCHGDLWSNNILLRYCDSGYPVGVKFIDLQAVRLSSCVLDVMHVLFTSSRPVVHEKHLDLLLTEYYAALVTNLKNLDATPGFTLEEFMAELRRKLPFGIFLACIMLTCVTRGSAPEDGALDEEALTSASGLAKAYGALSPRYHERLHTLFGALAECGLV